MLYAFAFILDPRAKMKDFHNALENSLKILHNG